MRRNVVVLLILLVLITGCTKKEAKKEKTNKTISCTSTVVENKINISSKFNFKVEKNKVSSGKVVVELTLPKTSSEEEIEQLKNISLCSTDRMTDLVNLGKCTTKVKDKTLKSTLVIDDDKLDDIDMDNIQKEIEKLSGSCIIKDE